MFLMITLLSYYFIYIILLIIGHDVSKILKRELKIVFPIKDLGLARLILRINISHCMQIRKL